ncbi:MAG TPA: hypothetical protein ENK18_15810, partial [Deltaproteobacteria bacterium]|nr:hypothetical protein [Deltaproteobacteria bacterium]
MIGEVVGRTHAHKLGDEGLEELLHRPSRATSSEPGVGLYHPPPHLVGTSGDNGVQAAPPGRCSRAQDPRGPLAPDTAGVGRPRRHLRVDRVPDRRGRAPAGGIVPGSRSDGGCRRGRRPLRGAAGRGRERTPRRLAGGPTRDRKDGIADGLQHHRPAPPPEPAHHAPPALARQDRHGTHKHAPAALPGRDRHRAQAAARSADGMDPVRRRFDEMGPLPPTGLGRRALRRACLVQDGSVGGSMFVLFAPLVALALEPAHVAEVAATAELPVDEVAAHLSGLVRDDSVLERMATPWERKPWHLYRGLFLTEARIEKGRAFRQLHAELFARAEAQTHVPASVILAILGVETTYGEGMGNDSVATALYTLGFHHRRRGRFFRSELGHFLRLATDEGWPIGEPLGSYAGAMGMGQFMPSSYRSYGVDFDK